MSLTWKKNFILFLLLLFRWKHQFTPMFFSFIFTGKTDALRPYKVPIHYSPVNLKCESFEIKKRPIPCVTCQKWGKKNNIYCRILFSLHGVLCLCCWSGDKFVLLLLQTNTLTGLKSPCYPGRHPVKQEIRKSRKAAAAATSFCNISSVKRSLKHPA